MSDANGTYERLQFLVGLLDQALSDFEAGRQDLGEVVRRVESAIDGLADVGDPNWILELRKLWAELEIINALKLDEGRAELRDDERRDVAATVTALRARVHR
jgi:hypothetical protein